MGELHRDSKISSDFQQELTRIITKFKKAGFPYAFINSVITTFNSEREEQIIPIIKRLETIF